MDENKPLAKLEAAEAAAAKDAGRTTEPQNRGTAEPQNQGAGEADHAAYAPKPGTQPEGADHPVRTPAPAAMTPQASRVAPDVDESELTEAQRAHRERQASRYVGPGVGDFRDARGRLPHERFATGVAPKPIVARTSPPADQPADPATKPAAEGTTQATGDGNGTGRR